LQKGSEILNVGEAEKSLGCANQKNCISPEQLKFDKQAFCTLGFEKIE
jgi:hypothetical protein